MVLKIILLLSYILSAVISIKLILENRDPSKTIIWILIFMLFPVVGIVIYAILGRNIRKLKINKASKMADNMKKENILFNLDEMKELAKGQSSMIKEGKLPGYENKDFRVLKIISLLLNTGIFPFTINNNIEIYVDGNEKFYNLISRGSKVFTLMIETALFGSLFLSALDKLLKMVFFISKTSISTKKALRMAVFKMLFSASL